QPAVSLQVRSLEKRLGRRLLDRSGRRVEPTEAGLALYQGAQRLLALEGQLLEELEAGEGGELGGTLEVGASTGPGSTVVPVLRRVGTRLSDLEPRLELGLQESARSAVTAGYGVTFISRAAIEADLAAGTLAVARVKGLDPSRQISLVRSTGRSPTRAADAFV